MAREQPLGPGHGLLEVGLGGDLARLAGGQPAQRRVLGLRPRRVRGPGGEHEPQVGVLVSGLPAGGGDRDDHHVA